MRVSRVGRAVVAGGAAVGLFLGAAACSGGDVDKGKLASKLKTEDDFKVLSAKQLDCVAGVFVKYADSGDLNDYVDGKKKLTEIDGDDEDKAAKEFVKCAT